MQFFNAITYRNISTLSCEIKNKYKLPILNDRKRNRKGGGEGDFYIFTLHQ